MVASNRFIGCRRQGTTLVLLCVTMIVLAAFVAFIVDVGRMYLIRSQLQTAVDAGALAATLQLKTDQDDIWAAVDAAEQFVQHNRVGSLVTIPTDAISVDVGNWDAESKTFSVFGGAPNAVRVTGNVIDEPLFFAGLIGVDMFSVPRTAVANGGGGVMDIMMALDLSGSMGSQGRIQALHAAAPEFVAVIEDEGDSDRIAVMGYGAELNSYDPVAKGHSGTVYLDTPSILYPNNSDWAAVLESGLTNDLASIRNHVVNAATLQANKYNGWTPTGAAIRDSAHYLDQNARSGAEKFIVLMSDGHANKPDGNGPGYARDMADYAAGLNIKVFTISLGDGADPDLMQDIADLTGGEHFAATGASSTLSAALTEAFRNVAEAIKRTQLVQ